YHLTPHCNGTHTECAGHITREAMNVNSVAPRSLLFAVVISVTPDRIVTQFSKDDHVITRESLQRKLSGHHNCNAVVIRTLPNDHKLRINYDSFSPAYFSEDALAWLASIGVDHLLVDLPSVDRMNDNGLLLAHRAFWGMPRSSQKLSDVRRSQATITELIYVPDHVSDGNYLLNFQVAPLVADAAPSRPLLYPLLNTDDET
ncbi:MAG: cyclase family protein, partial [Steroidobacter sp.]